MNSIRVLDSHTGGEPTRVLLENCALLEGDTMADKKKDFVRRWDWLRKRTILEPRGSDILVGALLTPPVNQGSLAGVIFFNNVGCLGMCGHGTIGVVETLRHIGRITPGPVALDTPVGTVEAYLHDNGQVSVANVESWAYASASVEVEGIGKVEGKVAYGGNWFFMAHSPLPLSLDRADELTRASLAIRTALHRKGITGDKGQEIDHIELCGPSEKADSKCFVLCPGGVYDRSPCGTGTSAKMACLAEEGLLQEGEVWRQESITGSIFEGVFRKSEKGVLPTITGKAYMTAETVLLFPDRDPLREGMSR